MYGGAAGGGKSVALLAGALQFVHVPGFHALLLRRTYADLNLPESLIPLSHSWLQGTDAFWNGTLREWTFPGGSTITFGYLETDVDKYRYQSAAFQYIGFDELTQFTEPQYQYLFSRLRRKEGVNVPLRMRSATNPGGVGHEWVKKRFLETDDIDRRFIPARLEDNPYLDAKSYETSLDRLDPVTRLQLRHGDWDVQADGVFKRKWFRYYKRDGDFYRLITGAENDKVVKVADCQRFGIADIAGTEKKKPGDDPDYSVLGIFDLTPQFDLLPIDVWRDRVETPDVEENIVKLAQRYDTPFVGVEWAGLGLGVVQSLRRRGMAIKGLKASGAARGSGISAKLARSQTAQIRMEGGAIYFPIRAPWLETWEAELLIFDGSGNTHDDQVDVLSYAAIHAQRVGGAIANDSDTEYQDARTKRLAKEDEDMEKQVELAVRKEQFDDERVWTRVY